MPSKNFTITFVFLLYFFCPGISAQQKDLLRFNNLTTIDGLPGNTINAIHQDKLGFLWLGTDHGIVRYDGYNFKLIDIKSSDGKLLNIEWIMSIAEDSLGNIYASTTSNGIFEINNSTQKVRKINFTNSENIPINLRLVSDIKINKSVLWIASSNKGLIGYDIKSQKVVKQYVIPYIADSTKNTEFYQISFDDLGNLWAASDNGLFKFFDDGSYLDYSAKYLKNIGGNIPMINAFYIDSRGNLWIHYWRKGLVRTKLNSTEYEFLAGEHGDSTKMPSLQIRRIIETSDGDIWFGTWGYGVFKYNYSDQLFETSHSSFLLYLQ